MEVNTLTNNNLSMFKSSNNTSQNGDKQPFDLHAQLSQDKTEDKKELQSAQETNKESKKEQLEEAVEEFDTDASIFDDRADAILDTLLGDKLDSEKVAVKSMLEKALGSEEDVITKQQLLAKLDTFIEDKKDGLNVDPYGLLNLANALKTLYQSDFTPLDIAV